MVCRLSSYEERLTPVHGDSFTHVRLWYSNETIKGRQRQLRHRAMFDRLSQELGWTWTRFERETKTNFRVHVWETEREDLTLKLGIAIIEEATPRRSATSKSRIA